MRTQTPLSVFVFLTTVAFISAVFLWIELVTLSPAAVHVCLIAQEPSRINQVLTLVPQNGCAVTSCTSCTQVTKVPGRL